MQKQKFELTSDLVKVESEPVGTSLPQQNVQVIQNPIPIKKIEEKEQINLRISSKIKKEFKIWCAKNFTNMTEALEMALKDLMKKNLF